MSVFDKFTNKVSDTAKAAAKKSGELVEVTKLSTALNQENEKISMMYENIGKSIYERYSAGDKLSEEIKIKCNEIEELMTNVQEMRNRINELKNIRTCKNCNQQIDHDVVYCPNCGTKQTISIKPNEDSNSEKK